MSKRYIFYDKDGFIKGIVRSYENEGISFWEAIGYLAIGIILIKWILSL